MRDRVIMSLVEKDAVEKHAVDEDVSKKDTVKEDVLVVKEHPIPQPT